jgi:alcohol dehydrogenase class IV
MNIDAFTLSRLPRILFGSGRIAELPALLREFGVNALLITGRKSFQSSPHWQPLIHAIEGLGIVWQREAVEGEPSPQWVDEVVARHRGKDIAVVVGIGGGSVLDAGKAVAGLLPHHDSVMHFLEGVGSGRYDGPALPYIAVPTTAGTGSEATKNAVLSVQGPEGFKKSFRHECLVPAYAVIDPQMLSSCTPALIAANGMDALTQLMESYVSIKANPISDALALSGIRAVKEGFFPAWEGGETPAAAAGRAAMAYAALLSGITLAQVGLGAVHGLASPLGAFFPIPHGVVCGTLLAATTAANIRALQARQAHHPALAKYAELGVLLSDTQAADLQTASASLVELLHAWTERLDLPRLRDYGVAAKDFPKIIANCRGNSMKTNPIVLDDQEVLAILEQRL